MNKKVIFPKEGEILTAKIKKIMNYGAFCSLDGYVDLEGFIHISEVAPRWIKNIHEFLKDGQKIVVKVIRIDEQKNQIDLSIKRVSKIEAEETLSLIKYKKRGEKLFEQFIIQNKIKQTEAKNLKNKIEKKYELIYDIFEDLLYEGKTSIKDLKLNTKTVNLLYEFTNKNIKKQQAKIEAILSFENHEGNGIEIIKKNLKKLEFSNELESVSFVYFGSPKYKITILSQEYKKAEKILEEIIKKLSKLKNSKISYERI